MKDTARIIITMILDVLFAVFSVQFFISRLHPATTKDTILMVVFALFAIYFIYSAIRKLIYLIQSHKD